MAIVYLALGSNLGDRALYLKEAIAYLKANDVRILKTSSFIETLPVGGPADQGKYLNAVLKAQTLLSPEQLLTITRSIENKLGRIRHQSNGPRVIDIDILLFDDLKIVSHHLTIPHLRMPFRDFVMQPLKEIDPKLYKDICHASR